MVIESSNLYSILSSIGFKEKPLSVDYYGVLHNLASIHYSSQAINFVYTLSQNSQLIVQMELSIYSSNYHFALLLVQKDKLEKEIIKVFS